MKFDNRKKAYVAKSFREAAKLGWELDEDPEIDELGSITDYGYRAMGDGSVEKAKIIVLSDMALALEAKDQADTIRNQNEEFLSTLGLSPSKALMDSVSDFRLKVELEWADLPETEEMTVREFAAVLNAPVGFLMELHRKAKLYDECC